MGLLEVVRSSGSMVKPREKTPTGKLELSGLDKVPVLRCNARTLHVYKHNADTNTSGNSTRTSASGVIREALSKALVLYYPLAGCLTEELCIDCSARGIWFIEASANCSLQSLDYLNNDGDEYVEDLLPIETNQFPCADQSNQPLVQMQVTEFGCGGFVIGLVFSHTICDGLGAAQFLNAVGELARGFEEPSVKPVWCRDFFVVDQPPPMPLPLPLMPNADEFSHELKLEQADFDIPMDRIDNLKRLFREETGGQTCSTFEIVAACLWMCRKRAIDAMNSSSLSSKLVFFANCRHLVEPTLPKGFYGNCFFPVTVTAPPNPEQVSLSDVVNLIKQAKTELPTQFAKYTTNSISNSNDPFFQAVSYEETVFVSEWGRLGFNEVDVGWGPPAHVVPIQGSPFIPACVIMWLPPPDHGIRLVTWCVRQLHRRHFLHYLSQLFFCT